MMINATDGAVCTCW